MRMLREAWKKRGLYLFLVPTLVFLLVFSYYPPLFAIYNAFFQWDGFGERVFVGIDNFAKIFKDTVFINSIGNLFKLLGFRLAIGLSVPLIVAELIFGLRRDGARYWYRLLFVIPMVVPGLVMTFMWRFILDPNVGLANAILEFIGGESWRQPWLGSTRTVLYSFMLIGFPYVSGINTLIYLAGLQNIPGEIFDACRVDGATGLRRFFSVDLPLVMGQVKLLLTLGVIGGLQAYQQQLILTNGGPGYASMMPGLVMYKEAFSFSSIGYASSIGVLMFLVILGLTYLNLRYVRSTAQLT
jgi:ABC-type sugar transport system permease subunit